jgi:hypothetical protein
MALKISKYYMNKIRIAKFEDLPQLFEKINKISDDTAYTKFIFYDLRKYIH